MTQPSPIKPASANGPTGDTALASPPATILVIDDNLANLRLLTDVLSSRNFTVHEAANGPAGLEMAANLLPDIILLDISMPEMDGFEVCRQLKANPPVQDIPVIFISALSDTDDIVKGFELGGVDYITKPFKFREVLARINNQLMLVRQRQEIEAMRDRDRQSFESLARMKNEFIRAATHDLRNPLNVILGYTQVLERVEVNEAHRRLLDESRQAIQDNVQKMRKLVTDMLDLAQMETAMQLQLEPVALGTFMDKALASFRVVAAQKKIVFRYFPPEADVQITLDVNAITRVIDNVVSNAIKYTPEGGRIGVRVQVADAQAVIEVADTGVGIPESDLPHLFSAFYRASQPDHPDVEGSGLGLSIAKALVERHGGTIAVKSQVGAGSVFTITLPLTPPRLPGTAPLRPH